jgi:hypothetical protein
MYGKDSIDLADFLGSGGGIFLTVVIIKVIFTINRLKTGSSLLLLPLRPV